MNMQKHIEFIKQENKAWNTNTTHTWKANPKIPFPFLLLFFIISIPKSRYVSRVITSCCSFLLLKTSLCSILKQSVCGSSLFRDIQILTSFGELTHWTKTANQIETSWNLYPKVCSSNLQISFKDLTHPSQT